MEGSALQFLFQRKTLPGRHPGLLAYRISTRETTSLVGHDFMDGLDRILYVLGGLFVEVILLDRIVPAGTELDDAHFAEVCEDDE